MAKTYAVRNITTAPPRPIGLMTGQTAKPLGNNCTLIAPDNVPAMLTEAQFDSCKDAIEKYENADMLSVKILDDNEKTDAERKEELEKIALEYGVDIDKRKSVKTLEAEVKKLQAKA